MEKLKGVCKNPWCKAETIKEKIKDVVRLYDNVIVVNKVTHNKMNPFSVKEVVIEWSNLVKTFEAFRWLK